MSNPFEKPPGQPEKPRVFDCPDCGGDGNRDGKSCSTCHGTGKIRDR